MKSGVKDSDAQPAAPVAVDWENRRLCGDGNCIGVIGPDGRCKECGRPAEPGGVFEEPGAEAPSAVEPAVQPSSPPPAAAAGGAQNDWENRRLCSDGNCIGVIGPDGRCRECGKPYAG
jgi:hypothetical protein